MLYERSSFVSDGWEGSEHPNRQRAAGVVGREQKDLEVDKIAERVGYLANERLLVQPDGPNTEEGGVVRARTARNTLPGGALAEG